MNEKDEELKEDTENSVDGGTHTPNSETDNTKASVEGIEEDNGENLNQDKKCDDDEPTDENSNDEPTEKNSDDKILTEKNPTEKNSGNENSTEKKPSVEPTEKMFTQSQVNELVGRVRQEAREAAMKQLLERYGVDTEDNLNTMFGNGQRYELLDENYRGLETKYGDAMTENALLKSQIVPGRWDDVKAILNSKGLEITPENIAYEMQTHPEWKGQDEITPSPAINKIDKLGDNTLEKPTQESDFDLAMRLMGVSR